MATATPIEDIDDFAFEAMETPMMGCTSNKLNFNSKLAPTPKFFQTELYDFQKAVVAKALDMEQQKVGPHIDDSINDCLIPQCIEYNAGGICTKFGTGKTVITCAIIASGQLPRATNLMASTITSAKWRKTSAIPASKGTFLSPETFPYSRCIYDIPTTKWIPCTLVVVSGAVYMQWMQCIEKFCPTLKCLGVQDKNELFDLIDKIHSGEITQYDMVLLKHGKSKCICHIARKPARKLFDCNSVIYPQPKKLSDRQEYKTMFMVQILASSIKVPWARLIIDDFDTLDFTFSNKLPIAEFTWYVSATSRVKSKGIVCSKDTTASLDKVYSQYPGMCPILDVTSMTVVGNESMSVLSRRSVPNKIYTSLSIDCHPSFINTSELKIPKPIYTMYSFDTPNVLKILIGCSVITPQLIEKICSGGIASAAQDLELAEECKSESDLIHGLMRKYEKKMENASNLLNCIAYVRGKVVDENEFSRNEESVMYFNSLFKLIKKSSKNEVNMESVDFFINKITTKIPAVLFSNTFDGLIESTTNSLAKNGNILKRFADNALEGECSICLMPFAECVEGCSKQIIHISKCCQTMICNVCINQGSKNNMMKVCPMCRHDPLQVIQINPNSVHLEDLAKRITEENDSAASAENSNILMNVSKMYYKQEKPAVVPEKEDSAVKSVNDIVSNVKFAAAINIILGNNVERCKISVGHKYSVLGENNPKDIQPTGTKRKIIVFAMAAESARKFILDAKKFNITLKELKGTPSAKKKVTNWFRKSELDTTCLVVVGPSNCSGVHIPETTDIILLHHIASDDVGAQLIGRGQRPGRKHSLRVHQLVYRPLEIE